jgi:hypothetical protein
VQLCPHSLDGQLQGADEPLSWECSQQRAQRIGNLRAPPCADKQEVKCDATPFVRQHAQVPRATSGLSWQSLSKSASVQWTRSPSSSCTDATNYIYNNPTKVLGARVGHTCRNADGWGLPKGGPPNAQSCGPYNFPLIAEGFGCDCNIKVAVATFGISLVSGLDPGAFVEREVFGHICYQRCPTHCCRN